MDLDILMEKLNMLKKDVNSTILIIAVNIQQNNTVNVLWRYANSEEINEFTI